MEQWTWPDKWSADAREALSAYINSEFQVDLWVDPPTALSGTRYSGAVYSDGDRLKIIYDRSGRPGIYPGDLPRGPLLRLKVRQGPGKRWKVAYAHPDWNPKGGLP